MRLLSLAALIALPIAATSAQAPRPARADASPPERHCPSPFEVHPADGRDQLKARRLGDLPPGKLVLTVMRSVDGCQEPVIVRHDMGAGSPLEQRRESGTRSPDTAWRW